MLELAAVVQHVRRRLRTTRSVGCRFVHLTDSQVTLGVMAKGRSSSRLLMGQLQVLGGLLLGGHLYMGAGWTKTDENPADAPSRRWAYHARVVNGRRVLGVMRTTKAKGSRP